MVLYVTGGACASINRVRKPDHLSSAATGPCNSSIDRIETELKNEDRQVGVRCVHRCRSGADSQRRDECHGDDRPQHRWVLPRICKVRSRDLAKTNCVFDRTRSAK